MANTQINTNFGTHNSYRATNAPQTSALRLRPGVQRLESGSFRPQVTIDDGGNGSIRFGDPLTMLKDAGDAAREACEAALPDGEWRAGWRSVASA